MVQRKQLTPKIWLTDLATVLDQASCKIRGKNSPLERGLIELLSLLKKIKNKKGCVWWIANGGSSSIGSHLHQDLINKLGVRSQVLTDASLLTCMANDFGYENVYQKPLSVLMTKNDLLISISSSGESKNILSATQYCLKKKIKTVTLSGFKNDNSLWKIKSDLSFHIESNLYGIVEVGHLALLHAAFESGAYDEK